MAITTGEVRLSYVHLTQPYAQKGGEPKYSCTLLIPKSDANTYNAILGAIEEAKQYGLQNKWNGAAPPNVPNPLHDGDGVKDNGEPYGAECKGHWVMTASCKQDHQPRVVDTNMQDIINPSDIYSGMYGRVSVNFYAYNFQGKKGIGCGLQHVQKLRDGEPLGGMAVSVEEAFGNAPGTNAAAIAQDQQVAQQATAQPQVANNMGSPAVDPITGQPLG